MGFQALKDVVTVVGQNLQRNYTLKLGTLQETIIVTDDGREHRAAGRQGADAAPPRAECAAIGRGRTDQAAEENTGHGTDLSRRIFAAPARAATVQLKARIALDGYLTDISVEGEAHPDLASAAVAAVREWQLHGDAAQLPAGRCRHEHLRHVQGLASVSDASLEHAADHHGRPEGRHYG